MACRVFISKNSTELDPELLQLEAQGFTFQGHSFLSYTGLPEEERDIWTEDADIVFFSSPRSVVFYFSQHAHSSQTVIACTGKTTAKLLSEMGYRVDFIGDKSGDMAIVADTFKKWVGTRKVLFPISDRSLKTVASVFPNNQKIERVVYRTLVEGKIIPPSDVYVFTSPSNVEGYFLSNELPEDSTVIAWGTSTEAELHKKNVFNAHILEDSSQQNLAKLLVEIK